MPNLSKWHSKKQFGNNVLPLSVFGNLSYSFSELGHEEKMIR